MIYANFTEETKENPSASFTPLFKSTSSPEKKNWEDIITSHKTYKLISAIKQQGRSAALSHKKSSRLRDRLQQSGNILFSKVKRHNTFIADHSGNLYAIHSILAKGTTCLVRMVQNLQTLEWSVVKIVKDNEERALAEMKILEKLNLFKGAQFRIAKNGTHKSYLFAPLTKGIKLKDFLQLVEKHKKVFSNIEQADILYSMLLTMQTFVTANVNHGDIHEKNALIDPLTYKVHLVDFGEATEIGTSGNHHQHYDIRKLFSLLKPIITDDALHSIANQHLFTWVNLKPNLQAAIDKVCALRAPLKMNRPEPR
jgi:serine/threonine protein kinase